MANDNTPPRLKLIVAIAAGTVLALVGVNLALVSYFAVMTDTAQREKIAPTTDRNERHAAEELAFTKAAVPLDEAMARFAEGARPEAITPQPSDDLGPMTGWSKMPKPAPKPFVAVPADADAGAEAAAAADAGAAITPRAPGAAAPGAAVTPHAPLGAAAPAGGGADAGAGGPAD